jgi:hypothetical protein
MTWYRASPSQEPRPQRAGLVGVLSDDPVDQGLGVLCDPSLDVERCKGEKSVYSLSCVERQTLTNLRAGLGVLLDGVEAAVTSDSR